MSEDPAVSIARLEATLSAKLKSDDERAAEWRRTHEETSTAIRDLAEVTNAGFLNLAREMGESTQRLTTHDTDIESLENSREADRRAGMTVGAGSGISVAVILEGIRHFIGFGQQ